QIPTGIDKIELLLRPRQFHTVEEIIQIDEELAVALQILDIGRHKGGVSGGLRPVYVGQKAVASVEEEKPLNGVAVLVIVIQCISDSFTGRQIITVVLGSCKDFDLIRGDQSELDE